MTQAPRLEMKLIREPDTHSLKPEQKQSGGGLGHHCSPQVASVYTAGGQESGFRTSQKPCSPTPREEGPWRLKSIVSSKAMGPHALGVDSLLAKSTCQGVCSLCGEAGWTWGWTAPMGPRQGRCKMGLSVS